jgi:dipeptidyl aminopeptidase/acylaminoacyl peptidase
MFKKNLLVSGLAVAIAALSPWLAAARPFTAQDMASLDRVSDPRLSPDGRFVLFDVRSVDFAANKSRHSLWLAETDGKTPPRRLAVSDDGASSGRWSTDGKSIYFLSGRKDGVDQLFKTDLKGEAATQVTALPADVAAFKLARDGKTLVVALAALPECPDLACSEDKIKARKAAKTSGVVFDRLFVRHWDSWADGRRNHLFALALDADGVAAGTPKDLMAGFDGDSPTKPFGDDEDFTITPDSRDLAFSAKLAGRDEAWTTNYDVYSVPLDGSHMPQNLTAANKAWDAAPVFSADGKWAAYRAMKRPGFESDRFGVILHDEATGRERELAPDWDHSAQSLKWGADNRTLYVTAEDVGQTRLFTIDSRSGKTAALTGAGHVAGFDVGADKLVFVQDDLSHPAQLYVADLKGGKAKALTSFNAERLRDVEWGEAEQFSFPGWNDETVHGYVVKPTRFDPTRSYPVAFLIHGGPQGSFGNLFHYRWNAEAFAGAGYAVVMIDFHGSTGYGQAFTDAISRHWGDRPLEDLQKGWQFALARYKFLDADRACALGGSYGGFMINWIAGSWNGPWKCLVNHDGIFDTRFMGYSTEELWFSEWENGGVPWDKATDFEKFNPADHVAEWSKPTLVVEGGKDYRVPLEEAISTFTALQRKGIPSKFLYFPDENHWVLKPQNVVQWYAEVNGWLDRWTGGK